MVEYHVKVGKGKTRRCDPKVEEWNRDYYEVTAVFDIQDTNPQRVGIELDRARDFLSHKVDTWLSLTETGAPGAPGPAPGRLPPPLPPPGLDPEELAKLPWTHFTGDPKRRCTAGEPGWIFSDTSGAEALVDVVQTQGQDVPVTIGNYEFLVKFSQDGKFLQRRPRQQK